MPVINKLSTLIETAWNKSALPGLNIIKISACGGGSINQVYHLLSNQGEMIVKINSLNRFPDMFRLEAEGLDALRKDDTPSVPRVLLVTGHGEYQLLFLEYFNPRKRIKNPELIFGTKLACLHKYTAAEFGWTESNYMGALVQLNGAEHTGAEFFRNQRLLPQLDIAFRKFGNDPVLQKLARVIEKIEQFIPDEKPALIHGDLWTGNCIYDNEGELALIDPAVSFGNREADLAMTFLFGGLDEVFLDAYNQVYPLVPGFRDRVDLWNLYPLLIHLNLFGISYMHSISSNLKRYG